MTDAHHHLWTALALLHTQLNAAIRRLERLRVSTLDPRLRTKLQPALVALRNGRLEDAERWITRALEYEHARRPTCNPRNSKRENAACVHSKLPTHLR